MIIFVPITFYHPNMDKDINRIKVVLAEKKRTNKWLAEQLGVNAATVSKWCTNSSQPSLDMLSNTGYLSSSVFTAATDPIICAFLSLMDAIDNYFLVSYTCVSGV